MKVTARQCRAALLCCFGSAALAFIEKDKAEEKNRRTSHLINYLEWELGR